MQRLQVVLCRDLARITMRTLFECGIVDLKEGNTGYLLENHEVSALAFSSP